MLSKKLSVVVTAGNNVTTSVGRADNFALPYQVLVVNCCPLGNSHVTRSLAISKVYVFVTAAILSNYYLSVDKLNLIIILIGLQLREIIFPFIVYLVNSCFCSFRTELKHCFLHLCTLANSLITHSSRV